MSTACPFQRFEKYAPYALSLLRIVSAYAFFLHGTSKAIGFPMDMSKALSGGWFSLMGVAAVLEIVGGILLMLGLFTRPVAFLLSGQMAVAYFMAHFSLFPLVKGGEAAMLFSFIFLYISLAGGGAWALDNKCPKNLKCPKPQA